MKLLEFIEKNCGKSLVQLLVKLFDALQKTAELLLAWHSSSAAKQQKKEQKQKESKIDDVTSHGTLEDLLDISRWEKTV